METQIIKQSLYVFKDVQTKIYYLNFSDCVTNPHWSFPSMLLANFFLPIVSPTHSLVCTVAVWSKSRSFSEHELRGPVYISTWRLAVSVQIPLHWSRITNDDTMGQHLCMSLLCLRGAFRTLYGIPEFRRWIYSGILRRCFGLIFKKSFKKTILFEKKLLEVVLDFFFVTKTQIVMDQIKLRQLSKKISYYCTSQNTTFNRNNLIIILTSNFLLSCQIFY